MVEWNDPVVTLVSKSSTSENYNNEKLKINPNNSELRWVVEVELAGNKWKVCGRRASFVSSRHVSEVRRRSYLARDFIIVTKCVECRVTVMAA